MSIDLHALRPTRLLPRQRARRRILALLAPLVVAGIGMTNSISALASSLPVALHDGGPAGITQPEVGPVQRHTVPASVQLPKITLRAEVEGVATPSWITPATGDLRDGFGPRPNPPVAGVSRFHRGQDIGAGCGAPVWATAPGRVLAAGWGGSYGNRVIIESAGGVETVYAHASRLLVGPSTRVKAGARIADVGNTGASTGCHLHFEVYVRGHAVDPVMFMLDRGVKLGA
jgi:murein DD-endopeptidase MepM/ murein hydrolase activator NlpD